MLTLLLMACSTSPKIPEGWKSVSIGQVFFYMPPSATVKEFSHDEGSVITVLLPGNENTLQIKVESGCSILPMSTMFTDTKDQIGYQIKYKVGDVYRNNSAILSKRGLTNLSISYLNLTSDQANTMDSIIKTISIKPSTSMQNP